MNIHGGDDACMNFRWLWNRWAFFFFFLFFFFFFLFFFFSLSPFFFFWCVNSAVKILMWSSTASPRPVQGRFLILFLSRSDTESYTDRPVYSKLLIWSYFYLIYHSFFYSVSTFCIVSHKFFISLTQKKYQTHCTNSPTTIIYFIYFSICSVVYLLIASNQ